MRDNENGEIDIKDVETRFLKQFHPKNKDKKNDLLYQSLSIIASDVDFVIHALMFSFFYIMKIKSNSKTKIMNKN